MEEKREYFRQDLWRKVFEEEMKIRSEALSSFRSYKRVKYFKLKAFMNKVFKTRYELYEKEEEGKKIKILAAKVPSIKEYKGE